jgi:hypothetical protein
LQSPKQLYSAELRLTLEEISSLYTLPERGVYAIIMTWFNSYLCNEQMNGDVKAERLRCQRSDEVAWMVSRSPPK